MSAEASDSNELTRTRKQAVRERIWALLDEQGAVDPPGSAGHIPSFVGADVAAERIADLPAWRDAQIVVANPDRAQLPLRVAALAAGKVVYMAVPRLETLEPFYELDPSQLAADVDLLAVATGQGAAGVVPRVQVGQMPFVDVLVCGSVAVDERGVRVGKGAGYSDIEFALLTEAGLIGPATTVVTTVHDLQVVDEPLPGTGHDFRVDFVVTPTRLVECSADARRPVGIVWDRLTQEQREGIPELGRRNRAVQED